MILFYFSGTGNTLYIAEQIQKAFSDASLLPMHKLADIPHEAINGKTLILLYPVYYIRPPVYVKKMLHQANTLLANATIILIATYSGNSGYAFKDIETILPQKPSQTFSIKMPGNYYREYSAYPKKYQDRLLKKADKKLETIIIAIKNRHVTRDKPINIISKLYNKKTTIIQNNFQMMDAQFKVSDACTKCTTCQNICPVQNISIEEQVQWHHHCEQCMACLQWCPENAITIENISPKRKRYTNPHISANRMITLNNMK
ncbi:EFR1 family ferrodoxin [Culicoidibacter larvae]|uniref:4Fe-4S ferredoxin-type domain-containing protein n=1 Tax=Culicoidibacter larvae TaxID=2579976 RepID=A0A5R8QFK1_9FIRM|nr:EFR1 family ferrodoxin [Culicoidibacter larvae]TLG76768.1 hypothetical protein FEZ08_03895 [Culicoidibacter larvae]